MTPTVANFIVFSLEPIDALVERSDVPREPRLVTLKLPQESIGRVHQGNFSGRLFLFRLFRVMGAGRAGLD
jgi:hypothetical protein